MEDSVKLDSLRNSDGLLTCQLCYKNFFTQTGFKLHECRHSDNPSDLVATLQKQQEQELHLLCPEKVDESIDNNDNITILFVKISDRSTEEDTGIEDSSINIKTTNFSSLPDKLVNVHPKKFSKIAESLKNQPNPYKCNMCPKKFTRIANLTHHINVVHENYRCFMCSKNFQYKYHLKQHIRLAHNFQKNFPRLKNYQCQTCEKYFARNCELKIHVNGVHEKLVNFSCKICNKSFNYYSALSKHVTRKHK